MKRFLLPALCLLSGLPAWAADPALTIYNQGFAVVREQLPLKLTAGVGTVSFSGLTAQLEPDSVVLRDPAGKAQFRVLEQSYRNDPASEGLLLFLNEGKTIRFLVEEQNGPDRTVQGKIVRSGYAPGGETTQPIIEVEGELRFTLPGKPLFPALGDDAILAPTLTWQIESAAATEFPAELGYVTGGLSWSASYNLVLPEKGDVLDVVGWVTVQNTSGKAFTNAQLQLLAGDVQKVKAVPTAYASVAGLEPMAAAPRAQVTEKEFDEFHLYSLPRRTTLRDKETKQVEFLRGTGVKATHIYEYDGAKQFPLHRGRGLMEINDGDYPKNTKVTSRIEFKNAKENQLGVALPAGRMRVYRQDGAALQFVGEDEIDHTPREETVRLTTGTSFDLVGERKQTNFRVDSSQNWAEETFEIELRNRQDADVEILVVERLYRGANWEILDPSQAFEKKDSRKIEFTVKVPGNQMRKVSYRVRYTW